MKLDRSIENTISRIYSLRENASINRLASLTKEEEERLPRLRDIRQRISKSYVELAKLGARVEEDEAAREKLVDEIGRLTSEREALREKNKITKTSSIYTCEICKDRGRLEGHWCKACYPSVFREAVYEESQYRTLLEKQNFQNFNLDIYTKKSTDGISPYDNIKKVVASLKGFIEKIPNNKKKGIIFFGHTGVGKTFLSSCLANEFIDRGFYVTYVSAVDVFNSTVNMFMQEDELRELNKYVSTDVLIIDDLGIEPDTEIFKSKLLDIIDKRAYFGKYTIISTNLSEINIRNRYTERFYSRLFGNYNSHNIIGNDFRISIDLNKKGELTNK